MPTDEQLIMEINSGSQAAMEVLTKRYYKQVYAYLYRKTGDNHTAYDLTQDVFIKMMRNLSSYSSKGTFRNWLFTIAINCSRDYFRSAAFRHEACAAEFQEHDQQSKGDTVSYIFENKETRKQLRGAIQELPDSQSEVILLKYYHDLKIREISVITGANENTVKSRLRQGLEKMKKLLRRDEDEQQQNQ